MQAVKKYFRTLKICRLSAEQVCLVTEWYRLLTCNSKGHVARGAVLVRACAPFITRRPILRSKAVTTFVVVTDEIRRSPIFERVYIRRDRYQGEQWCLAAQWLARQVSSMPHYYML
jgi:hypothetical protein